MMRSLLPLALLAPVALVACDTGTPDFWGVAPKRVEAGGMSFDIRVRGLRAEALRQNMMFPPPGDKAVAEAAALAIAEATGCKVAGLRGDPSVVEAELDCTGLTPPAAPARPAGFSCEGEILQRPALETEEIGLDCR